MPALRFLLDTCVVSELTRPAPDRGVLAALATHEAQCAIAAATLEELVFGCRRLPPGARRDWLLRWVAGLPDHLPVLPYDQACALWLGAERARLAAAGRVAPRTDGEIASIAATQGLTMVTRNVRDFAIFDGLAVIDWHAGA